ncbi:MAG: hypothetical protein COV02_00870 [Candidatus Terrybacteria bacterium CG10_big_fil_rev_8_21_14_0_10_41_10]|uniref:Bacterial type II secretion system protein E domain-containing protein n=1 Tax=Candidatus Terrybacteria bacterium CG10_big_fil_rev_8_21_14_0_10_41_10 TaxID=1975026 RepID=A0A2M8LAX7_9BACT|nr:MAG: hypothetical protein COV02_00870 [Candidatus Terrybacteria bacterium CG10_big_fil_rev_8_21_14_0_10_41_10]
MLFSEVLVKNGVIEEGELSKLFNRARKENVSLEKLLISEGIPEETILQAKSESLNIPIKRISKGQVPFDVLRKVPEEAVSHYRFIPVGMSDGVLEVGIIDPDNIEAREAIQFITSRMNVAVKLFLISEADFESLLEDYKGIGGEVSKALGDLETALVETIEDDMEIKKESDKKTPTIVEDAPVTKIVAVILRHAIAGRASDIHIEATPKKVKVRFRVDGTLYTSILLPINIHEAIVSRIKILCNMKIDEKRKPQDGRFSARIENREIDFRVSTFPSVFGEKVVIRILDKEKGIKSLSELGFSADQLDIVNKAIDKPYGLILITGPTGSGKTTSLYAMLKELDKEENNVVSLEDPVEYIIEGVNQSQVRPEIGYDFANGLRSILRQDPDMIMVGEIRDKETAALAIHAALTGHLVFATLHTNSAAGAVSRLIDMGVDPFLIAPTLVMVIGQRLVKGLCQDSRKEVPISPAIKNILMRHLEDTPEEVKNKIKIPDNIYESVISPVCPRGTRGRFGVFEILYKTPGLETAILERPTEQDIMKEARKQGMFTMKEDGMIKMFNGLISLEEYLKL